jgi:hypothetical protein
LSSHQSTEFDFGFGFEDSIFDGMYDKSKIKRKDSKECPLQTDPEYLNKSPTSEKAYSF